ncbi:MAG: ATP-binding protein [Methylobacter sp.]
METCTGSGREEALETYPFLTDYAEELANNFKQAGPTAIEWRNALELWENNSPIKLPLLSLLSAGLSRLELELILVTGLLEEDPRFSDLFSHATGGERRPTAGLLLAWWRGNEVGQDRVEEVRRSIQSLIRMSLLQVLNPDAPRSEWALAVPAALWDVLRGGMPELKWLRCIVKKDLISLKDYKAASSVLDRCKQLPRLLDVQPEQLLIVRGPSQNGRKTLVGAVAQSMGKDLLVTHSSILDDEMHWQLLGIIAVILDAMPLIEFSLLPGENRTLPTLPLVSGPIAIVMGMHGGINSDTGHSLITLILPIPNAELRLLHWQDSVPTQDKPALTSLAQTVFLTSGNIRRVARAAVCYAQMDHRNSITHHDVQLACRSLHSARLETLATRLETTGSLTDLVVDDVTRSELDSLVLRCRFRELLALFIRDGGENTTGVRALFSGPSGTGKTLAARLSAATLGKDLYRVDLAATVNKYLGETEKSLDQAFSAAEELDVILLLDEGDALMTSRTDVSSSNDRYANLETNFLLQRIESFNGILFVTTNAADRIDKAFARRMEVVIQFNAPDDLRRYEILSLLLGTHAIDDDWLQELACRCSFTGGQLRNVIIHAKLLALESQRVIDAEHLYTALLREYRKIGAHCPLQRPKS